MKCILDSYHPRENFLLKILNKPIVNNLNVAQCSLVHLLQKALAVQLAMTSFFSLVSSISNPARQSGCPPKSSQLNP